jgi:hypothetical protein
MGASIPEKFKNFDLVAIDCFLLIYPLVVLAFFVGICACCSTDYNQQREYY